MPAEVPRASPRSGDRFRVRGQADSTDLLVLGGGVLGLSTACAALTRGLSVTLLDENPEASATLASAGMLSPYAERIASDSLQELMRQARAAYPAFVERLEQGSGVKVELNFPGTLLASEQPGRQEELKQLAERLRETGARCRYLDSEEAEREEPKLAALSSGVVLLEEEGYVNTHSLHQALRMCFDRLGGRWVKLSGLGLVVRQQRVVGVETALGVLLGEAVLNATGAAADRFLLPEDAERYRPRPIRGQAVRLRPPSRSEGIRRVILARGLGYLVPQADGTVIAGATSEDAGPFTATTAGGVRSVLESAARLVPASGHWSFVSAWSGLRPLAGDGEMVLLADSRRGLFHGLGLYRHGVLLAPVASTKLIKMILDYLGRNGS